MLTERTEKKSHKNSLSVMFKNWNWNTRSQSKYYKLFREKKAQLKLHKTKIHFCSCLFLKCVIFLSSCSSEEKNTFCVLLCCRNAASVKSTRDIYMLRFLTLKRQWWHEVRLFIQRDDKSNFCLLSESFLFLLKTAMIFPPKRWWNEVKMLVTRSFDNLPKLRFKTPDIVVNKIVCFVN
jgi:hypothetical protein